MFQDEQNSDSTLGKQNEKPSKKASMSDEQEEKRHKHELFEKELYCHANALYNVALYWSHDETIAQDLVQDTFVRAYKALDNYEIGSNAKAWLFKILRHLWINKAKSRTSKPTHKNIEDVIKQHDHESGRDFGLYTAGNESTNRRDDFSDEVAIALNQLSEEVQMLLLLCYIENLSYEELSEIFEVPIGTVRSRLHRARRTLENSLWEYAATEGYNIKTDKKSEKDRD